MSRLLGFGLLAALFFSSTFVLNRAMSLGGGSWVWSASLRYAFNLLFIILVFVLSGRAALIGRALRVFRDHFLFWVVAGCIGFGLFYTGITFAATYAPAWVVAATWQVTILATPIVLAAFGRRVPLRGVAFTLLIFAGVLLVNVENAAQTSWHSLLLGAAPVLVAAFAFPFGMQMVWEAHSGKGGRFARIDDPVLDNPLGGVLLLVLGSIPWWVALVLIMQPPPPTTGQWVSTAIVALFSGIIASGFFVHARYLAKSPYELAAVDSTQSGEVVFSLIGEVVLLGGMLPGPLGWAGIALTIVGMSLYILAQGRGAARQPVEAENPTEPDNAHA